MLTNMKRNLGLLLAVATLSAVTALVPSTAGAAASKVPNLGTTVPADPYSAPSNDAVTTACPMSSAAAAGFTDTTSTDVDCIKMFGITQGTTATTYEPAASIPRWQMALFLHRMFVPTGLAAAGLTAVPAFTDTAGLSTEITAAITAIASHGITVGTSATTFSPNDNVSRDQMALFLYRMGLLIKPYNVASNAGTANGIFADGAAGADIASGTVNYSDIALMSIEAWEAIAAMYNLGGAGETCVNTAASLPTCGTTYRPTADITRAEMATMIKSVLDASNARPVGCTIQNDQVLVAGGGAETTSISCRNADFTPQLNTTVDEFYQVRNDATAATAAVSVPFNALSGLVSTSGGSGVTGSGTAGTVDAGDRITNALGNAAGFGCAAIAAGTCRHWVHTGAQGAIYINGSTVGFAWEGALSAAAVASTYATTMTSAIAGAAASATCNMGGAGSTLGAAVTATDHECAYQGTTKTITTTLTGATAAAVVDGYTVKYTDKVVSYGGGTGNQSLTYNISYVAVVGGVATFDVVCSADHLPLASNAALNGGAVAGAEYYESHEVTVDLGTAAAGTGIATGGADITGGSIVGNTDVACDDVPRAYADGQHAQTVNQNYATVSTAGTLVTSTATAYDQYGVGIAGVSVSFDTDTKKNLALTAEATTASTLRSTLITNTDGVAVYSGVACDSASVGLSGSVAFSIDDEGGGTEMSDTALTVPTATSEGTTIHCVAAGVDAVTATTGTINVPVGNEVSTFSFTATVGGAAQDPKTGSNFTITIGDATTCGATFVTGAIDGNATQAQIKAAIELLTCVTTVTVAATGTTWTGFTVAHLDNSGDWPDMVYTVGVAIIAHGDDAAGQGAVVTTTPGAYGTTFDHVDHDPAADNLIAKRTVKQRTAAGAAVVTSDYSLWTYDDTDALNTTTLGLTMAQWEAALLADAGTSATDLSIAYRTAATSTGVSSFKLG